MHVYARTETVSTDNTYYSVSISTKRDAHLTSKDLLNRDSNRNLGMTYGSEKDERTWKLLDLNPRPATAGSIAQKQFFFTMAWPISPCNFF